MLWKDESVRLKAVVTDGSEYSQIIEPLKKVDVLYIDDFLKTERGKFPTTGDVNIAFELINHRYINKKITIFSSERDVDEIIDIDEATGSRIYERTKNGVYLSVSKDKSKNYRLG